MNKSIIQTMFFQEQHIEAEGKRQIFVNPIQIALTDGFPVTFEFSILSSVHGAQQGQLGCTHVVEFNGENILRCDHSIATIPFEGAGIAFQLQIQQLHLNQAGILVIKTMLSDGSRGEDVPLPVLVRDGATVTDKRQTEIR